MPEEVVRETLIHVTLGLWNNGFLKQIIVNNHGQLWMLEAALHEFMYWYQLPGIYQVVDWHRAVREFFFPRGGEDSLETHFVQADEAEASIPLLLFPKGMVDMSKATRTEPRQFFSSGHFDTSVDDCRRPYRWSEGEGHMAIEIAATPEGVIGDPTRASARKAKRAIAAILAYLTLVIDQILQAFPPGTVPPVEKVTLWSNRELQPYLQEPGTPGWRSVYGLVSREF